MTQGFQAVLWSSSPVYSQKPESEPAGCHVAVASAEQPAGNAVPLTSVSLAVFNTRLALFLTGLEGEKGLGEYCSCPGL